MRLGRVPAQTRTGGICEMKNKVPQIGFVIDSLYHNFDKYGNQHDFKQIRKDVKKLVRLLKGLK